MSHAVIASGRAGLDSRWDEVTRAASLQGGADKREVLSEGRRSHGCELWAPSNRVYDMMKGFSRPPPPLHGGVQSTVSRMCSYIMDEAL